MTIQELRRMRDMLSIILAAAKDKNLNLTIYIKETNVGTPYIEIYFPKPEDSHD